MVRLWKDMRGVLSALRPSTGKPNGFYFWDDAQRETLTALVDHLSNPQDLERRVIRSILHDLEPKTILDAGCGPATELEGYAQAGLNVTYTGLDQSVYMLTRARERYPHAQLIHGSIEQMPFAQSQFDVVLLKHVLEHLNGYEQAVHEAVRVSDKAIVINFFHRLIPGPFDIKRWTQYQYWDNWYSKPKFEQFLGSLPIKRVEKQQTTGISGQTAEIYLLQKS